jgi:RNA recognition motif-containing protein
MAKRLYVGNLPYTVTREELSGLFTEWGPVQSADIIIDHLTGQSKGFGFIQLPDENADAAVARMNGSPFQGRPLKVNEARPREERPRSGAGGYGDSRGADSRGSARGGSRSDEMRSPDGKTRTFDVMEEYPDVRRNRPTEPPSGENARPYASRPSNARTSGPRHGGFRDGGEPSRGREVPWKEPTKGKNRENPRHREREREPEEGDSDWE